MCASSSSSARGESCREGFALPTTLPWPILGLLLLFLVLSCVYNANVPLGEGPDEPGHLAYVLFLVREGHLPVQRASQAASDVPGEGHQPPLAYLLAVPALAWLPPADRQVGLTSDPAFVWAGGDQPGAFMRGSREYWPWQGSTLAWHLARAISALCGATTVLCTYLAARTLWPDRRSTPLLAAAIVAFNPQFLFSCALVSNDPLLAALSAAILWRSMDLAGRATPPTWPAFGLAGLLFGLALLTKQSALLLGPLLLWAAWRAAGGGLRRAAGYCLAWGLTATLVAGWWYLRNLQLYGDLFGLALFSAEFAGQSFAWGDPTAWLGGLSQLCDSFWARFGWMSVWPPAWSLWAYWVLLGVALVGWALSRPKRPVGLWFGPLLLLVMAVAWLLSFVATAGLVAWQGRMLFPAIGAIGIMLAGGIEKVKGKRQKVKGLVLPFAFCLLLFALSVFMPLGVIAPAYPWVALPESQARTALGTPTYARFADSWKQGVVLRGWRLEGLALPGADLPLSLTWNSLEPLPSNWTVFVHLLDASGEIVAKSNLQPRNASLPFTVWTPGDWVVDQQRLALPASLPPGRYQLIVGLYLPEQDGARLAVWAEDGSLIGDKVEVGEVLVGT
jgi:hypothetical protein